MYNYGNQRGRSNNNNFRRRFGPKPSNSNSVFAYIKKATINAQESILEDIQVGLAINELELDNRLADQITRKGFREFTPIQSKAIPAILEGRDIIGIANTGTGKTAAFLIPIIEKIIQDHSIKTIIVTPTRELALQIQEELHSLSRGFPIRSAVCIGQSSMRKQIGDLRRSPEVVIGTPGRLLDLTKQRYLNMSMFNIVVLDEVDQMLDMGFINDVRKIVSSLPVERQSLFFSATITPSIESIIKTFTKEPVTISVKTQETTSHIRQDVIKHTSESHKVEVLNGLLKQPELKKVLIFGQTKHGVEKLTQDLYANGFRVTSIHGNKSQSQRQQAIRHFKEDIVKILVATDVAARGLDINNISHVINYDAPDNYESYIHRIGRTGRAQKSGVALTFVKA